MRDGRLIITIKDWREYQHYKGRNPPWIKLHRKMLNDLHFMSLAPASRCLLMMLWILATDHDGQVIGTEEEIKFWLRDPKFTVKQLNPLISTKFIFMQADASTCKQTLADGNKCSSETDTETDTDNTDSKKIKKKVLAERPEEVSEEVWEAFKYHREKKRAAVTMIALDGIREEAAKAGYTLEAALKECCERGWQGFKADWVKTNGHTKPDEPIKKGSGLRNWSRQSQEDVVLSDMPEEAREKIDRLLGKKMAMGDE